MRRRLCCLGPAWQVSSCSCGNLAVLCTCVLPPCASLSASRKLALASTSRPAFSAGRSCPSRGAAELRATFVQARNSQVSLKPNLQVGVRHARLKCGATWTFQGMGPSASLGVREAGHRSFRCRGATRVGFLCPEVDTSACYPASMMTRPATRSLLTERSLTCVPDRVHAIQIDN